MHILPTGTVTFLFSDIEGSTQLLQRVGGRRYAELLGKHQALLRAAWAAQGGVEIATEGDSFFVAFSSAPAAVAAAAQATRALAAHAWPEGTAIRVRIGLHTGVPAVAGDNYVGLDIHRAARIAAAGHGGQTLLSVATRVLAESELPEGALLRDLGEFRLKDLQRPEHLAQLVLDGLPSDFPPLKTLDRARHNLPVQPTPLLGRAREVEELTAMLRRDDVRLVTLTGTGGTGKTRLGQQVAAELAEAFPDGIWVVRFARLVDPALVLPTIAQTLGLQDLGSRPLEETLRTYLREKHLLLLLDNFEQLTPAVPQIATLLEESPRLKVLVTSRVPLHLRGEKEYPVAPLALPPAAMSSTPAPQPTSPSTTPLSWRGEIGRLTQYAAVALFIQRALDARPNFQVTNANASAVAEICARLDGLPLAIELAAARIKLLPPQQLLQRLERRLPLLTGGAQDLLERQQTMRATLAWSEDLLTPSERVLFRRLAVFVGGCTLEAAEAVCAAPKGTEPLRIDVLDGLGRLVDQSLVQQREEGSEAHFGQLQVVREYALERLDGSEEGEALRQAHAGYFLALAERAEAELNGPEQGSWFARLERERDNLRSVLGWARERGEAEMGLRLGSALGRFWRERGHFAEGRTWLEGLLASCTSEAEAGNALLVLRARAYENAGWMANLQGDSLTAKAHHEQALALARQAGEVRTEASALNSLGGLVLHEGDLDGAAAYYAQSLEVARQAGDQWSASRAQGNLGLVPYFRGDLPAAQAQVDESIVAVRALGDRIGLSVHLANAGSIARKRGDFGRAWALQREALAVQWEMDTRRFIAETLLMLAATAAASGMGEQAARLYGATAALQQRLGYPARALWRVDTEEAVAPARATLGEERWAAAFAAGRALSLEEAITEALGEGEKANNA
jgi:predicted ATPase/class 3 adenylate cyclase